MRSTLLTKFLSSIIPSVYTDWITDGMFRIKKTKGGSLTWRFLRVIFSIRITEGFKTAALRMVTWPVHHLKCQQNYRGIQNGRFVWWHVLFADGLIDGILPSVKLSKKVNKCSLYRPSPLLVLLFFLHPNSPQLQTTTQKKNLPLLSTTSYISWSFVVTASMFWFTDGVYQFL